MRENTLATRLAHDPPAVNAWMSCGSPYLAEVLSHSGVDSVTVDLQHGMFGLDGAVALLQAVSAGPATPMARCSSLDAAEIGKLLDAGAYGIICPDVDGADECARFVATCRYPPSGTRSFGPARGLLYGGRDYFAHADDVVLTWAMVESVTSLAAVDEICAVPGLDGVYVGPNDLALSMGLAPGADPQQPELVEAITAVLAAARSRGVATGIFCPDGRAARAWADRGFDMVTPGNDVGMVRAAVAREVVEVRGPGDA